MKQLDPFDAYVEKCAQMLYGSEGTGQVAEILEGFQRLRGELRQLKAVAADIGQERITAAERAITNADLLRQWLQNAPVAIGYEAYDAVREVAKKAELLARSDDALAVQYCQRISLVAELLRDLGYNLIAGGPSLWEKCATAAHELKGRKGVAADPLRYWILRFTLGPVVNMAVMEDFKRGPRQSPITLRELMERLSEVSSLEVLDETFVRKCCKQLGIILARDKLGRRPKK